MRNAEIALHFDELADLYELDGAIVHRVVAYRNAAKAIREATASVAEMSRAGTVTKLPGIGEKAEENVRIALEAGPDPRKQPRLLLSRALAIADALVSALREHPAAE